MASSMFLGPAARAIRKRTGITRVAMAEALGCSPRWVSRIESGQRQPSEELAARYAARVRVSLDTLYAQARDVA